MRELIFDTETTDKWNFKAGIESDKQPNVVQLAMRLVEGEKSLFTFSGVASDCGVVAAEAAAIHGITPERSRLEGFKTATMLVIFRRMAAIADRIVAHNADFDRKVIQRAFIINKFELDIQAPYVCTMKSLTDTCNLPGKYGKPKWPTLDEAYRAVVDPKGFDGAHDALADVDACWALVRACKARSIPLLEYNARA